MFSADVFTFVENFLGSATSFIYSYLFSIAVLLRFPVRGAHYLERRYVIKGIKQVGPLSIHFVTFLGVLIVGAYPRADTASELFKYLTDEDKKASGLAMVVGALAGTAAIDFLARCAVLAGWPRGPALGPLYKAASFTSRRVVASYMLAIPVLMAAAAAVAQTLSGHSFIDVPGDTFGIAGAISSVVLASFVTFRLTILHFVRRFRAPGTRRPWSMRLAASASREAMVVVGFASVIAATAIPYNLFSRYYKVDDGASKLSDIGDVTPLYTSCAPAGARKIKVASIIYNRGKGLAVFTSGSLDVSDQGTGESLARADLPAPPQAVDGVFVIGSNSALTYSVVVDLPVASTKPWTCDVTWLLQSGGRLRGSADYFPAD